MISNGSKKNMAFSIDQRRSMIEPATREMSIKHQCELLSLARSSFYYQPWEWNEAALEVMRVIDETFTRYPFYGKRRMSQYLQERGYPIGVKRTRTLMEYMGLVPIVPSPNTSKPHPSHWKYPYLLGGLSITYPNQVWAIDITYIRLIQGFVYLTAVQDWFSRYVISWELSPTLDSEFCVRCVEEGFRKRGKPEIINSDQGSQFTSDEYIKTVEDAGVQISMDGKGRAFDNIMIERLWRTVKYEEVYLKEYSGIPDCRSNLARYFRFYNTKRIHSSLGGTPYAVYSRGKIFV